MLDKDTICFHICPADTASRHRMFLRTILYGSDGSGDICETGGYVKSKPGQRDSVVSSGLNQGIVG